MKYVVCCDGYVCGTKESEQVLENALVDRSVVNTAHHSEHPVYQFERIGYFCLDSDSCSDEVDKQVDVKHMYTISSFFTAHL